LNNFTMVAYPCRCVMTPRCRPSCRILPDELCKE
jgi:hypothetical protein